MDVGVDGRNMCPVLFEEIINNIRKFIRLAVLKNEYLYELDRQTDSWWTLWITVAKEKRTEENPKRREDQRTLKICRQCLVSKDKATQTD